MKCCVEVLFEGRLEGVRVQALINLLAVRTVDLLLEVQRALLTILSLLLLLKHWKEVGRWSDAALLKELNQQRLIVGDVCERSAWEMTGVCWIHSWNAEWVHASPLRIVLKEGLHLRLKTLNIALHHRQIVRVLLARLVDAIIASVRRLI